jgi:hypothetical protein
MLMLYSLCGNSKEIKRCMRYECYSRRGQCCRVSNDKSRKGFFTCVEKTREVAKAQQHWGEIFRSWQVPPV